MSEVLSGARYTFGALVVLTLWSIGMVQVVEWKLDYSAAQMTEEMAESDRSLLRFGPDPGEGDRYHELRRAAGLE